MSDVEEQSDKDQMHMEKLGLDAEQIAELKECYALFDKGDEGVAVEDIGNVLRAMGQNPTEQQCQDMASDAEGMGQNGMLTVDDFITIAGSRLQPESEMVENLEEAFKYFDRLGTGCVDEEELREKLSTLGEALDPEDINDMMKMVDKDKYGKFYYDDLVKKIRTK